MIIVLIKSEKLCLKIFFAKLTNFYKFNENLLSYESTT